VPACASAIAQVKQTRLGMACITGLTWHQPIITYCCFNDILPYEHFSRWMMQMTYMMQVPSKRGRPVVTY